VVKYLPVADDGIKFAAGLDKLVVYLPGANVLQRWDLATLQREVTLPNPVSGTVDVVEMGSASRGPLLLGTTDDAGGGSLTFLDPLTFRAPPFQRLGRRDGRAFRFDGTVPAVRVSADGRLVTLWAPRTSPSGLEALVFNGRTVRGRYEHTEA